MSALHKDQLSSGQLKFLFERKVALLAKKYPDEIESRQIDDETAQALSILSGMVSPKSFVQVVNHIFAELDKAHGNGHKIAFEHHSFKSNSLNGTVDHHRSDKRNREQEPYWGLMCATLMSAIPALLNLYDRLQGVPEEYLDQDQENALLLFHMAGGTVPDSLAQAMIARLAEINSTTQEASIRDVLDSVMGPLQAEEFSVYGQGQAPRPIPEIVSEVKKSENQPGFKTEAFTIPRIDVSVWESKNASLAPILLVHTDLKMLPVRQGRWNEILQRKLLDLGFGSMLKAGAVTILVHDANKGKEITAEFRSAKAREVNQDVYEPYQTFKPTRLVFGIVANNQLPWDKQRDQLRRTIETHERVTDLAQQIYDLKIRRNILAIASKSNSSVASNKGDELSLTKKQKQAVGKDQLCFLALMDELRNLGYVLKSAMTDGGQFSQEVAAV